METNSARQKILDYIEECSQNGHRPTIREICKHTGISSTSHVHYHMIRSGIDASRKVKYPGLFTTNLTKIRKKLIEMLGGKCVRCGYDSDIRALQIDHVNGGGLRERNSLTQRGMYAKMYKEITEGHQDNYQVLCANCNWIKKSENGE